MIDAKEIKIDNWLEHSANWSYRSDAKVPFKFQWDSSDWYALGECTLDLENVFPIPLTPDMLIACGFEKTTKYRYEKDDLKFSIYVWDTGRITAETNDCDLCQLEYLHQLQNLFYSLTQKELEIKL